MAWKNARINTSVVSMIRNLKHVELFQQTWQAGDRAIVTLNKFCKIYINHFDGAKELREQLMNAVTADELLDILKAAP